MEYGKLVAVYDRLAATDATIGKREILAETFQSADGMLDRLVTLVRGRLAPAHSQVELGVSSSLTLEAILQATGASEDAVREQWRETGDLGDAAAWAVEHGGQQTLFSEELTVERVQDTLTELAAYEGEGSQGRRIDALAGLLADASPNEARYVVRTALGHMRLGIGEGTIRDAIAVAFLDGSEEAVNSVERGYQVTNDFRVVAATARDEGQSGLEVLDIQLFRPIQSMLAEKAESLDGALRDAVGDGRVRCEIKYDGIRIQLHVHEDDVRLFTRRLEDVTQQFPDAVQAVKSGVTAEEVVLDGELVGYTPTSITSGQRVSVPFQDLSRRVKREEDIQAMAREIPVIIHVFDCLYDGTSLVERPLETRLDRLTETFHAVEPDPDDGIGGLELASAVWARPEEPGPAEDLYETALAGGHEGLMLKDPTATYEPGRRVGRLLKLKPTMEPLDLVVTRAMYSEGRRSEMLGRLYLACYDSADGELREVGRLSTGYTDDELASLTERLEDLIIKQDGRNVDLDPAVVLEVEYEEIQESPEYDSGYALRFPRFLSIREDLSPEDADSLQRIETLYEDQ